jgi:hypothetical protein
MTLMQVITPTAAPEEATGPPPSRWTRPLRWVVASLLVLAATFLLLMWWLTRPPAPVSVPDVINRFRSTEPSAAAVVDGGPARGVYLYATRGTERVSTGNVTHHYPARTTLTVTSAPCGLTVRWEALSGRWSEATLCRTSAGWRVVRYVDVHTFLYMKDVHEYTCTGFPVVVCDAGTGLLTSTFEQIGPESTRVGGVSLPATHVRITQSATGKSTSEGVIDAWILPSGLPGRLEITDHGSQVVLGASVRYNESATFVLTSTKPRR